MSLVIVIVVVAFIAFVVWKSFHAIGAAQVGLVSKRFAVRKLDEDNPVAFRGEAGYQARLLMPGLRFKLWPLFGVKKFPWVQVPAGEIGVVIAQVGEPLPIGAKSAVYRPELANFSNLHTFVEAAGQKGVQRPVLPPGTLVPVHPVAFLVLTPETVYGLPVSPDLATQAKGGMLSPESFGLSPDQLRVVVIAPDPNGIDLVGVVTALEGEPLPSGDIASRLGGFADVAAIEATNAGGSTSTTDAQLIDLLLGSKNNLHNNYQDFQGSSTTAARSACSTTRCSTARTCSTRSWSASSSCPCWSSTRARSRSSRPTSGSRPRTRRARSSSSARSCGPATAASGRSRCAPASTRSTRALRGGDRPHVRSSRSTGPTRPPRPTTSTHSCRRSWARAARASSSRSTSRCRSTCPTRRHRR